ncbi:MAG: ATP-binding protein [Bacteroidales bacterium]
MKIRTKLTLRYTSTTAAIFIIFALMVYVFSEKNREREFFRDLKREAITKANLFLEKKVDASTMQSIYMNNREFINEVEVAVYDTSFHLLYHDAKQIDLVKETPEMIKDIIRDKTVDFYQDHNQVVGLLYFFKDKPYVITAVAYDGYGYAKLNALKNILISLCSIGLILLFAIGYYLSKRALNPVIQMDEEIKNITASNLDKRLYISSPPDEIDELAISFNQMLDKLEESFNSQRLFMSNVSHEIRTPLAIIQGEIDVALLRSRSMEEYVEILHAIQSDSKHITHLLNGLSDLSKASYQPEQISFSDVRLDEVLLDARDLILKNNPHARVDLIFEQESEDESDLIIRGNDYLLKVAFMNLMENNVKYSASHLSTVQIAYFNNKSIIRFSDDGIGISSEEIENIFQPFFRGKNAYYTKGTGIGLTMVRKIVRLHHGEVYVNSHLGEGTVFTIEFPHI